jgi:hypothetical protein
MRTIELTDGGILLYDELFLPPDLASEYFAELLEKTPWERKPGLLTSSSPNRDFPIGFRSTTTIAVRQSADRPGDNG